MRGRFRCTLASALTLIVLAWSAPIALAQAVSRFDLPAQPLADSLRAVGSQTNLNVLFDPPLVADRLASALKGEFSTNQAFTLLLAGTGIQHEFMNERTVVLAAAPTAKPTAGDEGANRENSARTSWLDRFRLAQADTQSSQDQVSPNSSETQSTQTDKKLDTSSDVSNSRVMEEEIVVTGTRLPGQHDVPGLQIYDQENIHQSGQNTVADFLNTLPSTSISTTENGSQTFRGATTVRLRGLPLGTTLVLLNGRRLETSGAQAGADFFDLNNIPLGAVERVEVVANGASAVYGSDAIAGVVNIVLRSNFNAVEGSAKYGWADDIEEYTANLAYGREWQGGSFSIVGTYQTRDALLGLDREITASNDYRAFGGPNNNFPVCNPGNVFSRTGGPLPGSTFTFAAVSGNVTSGRPALTDFNYGVLNECALAGRSSHIPESERFGFASQGALELTPSVDLFAELLYSHVVTVGTGNQSLFGIGAFQQFTVSAENPFNPFGVTVGVAGMFDDAELRHVMTTDFLRPVVGIRGHLGAEWSWELAGWRSQDEGELASSNLISNAAAVQAALNSSDPNTALNPFVAGAYGNPALIDSLFTDGLVRYEGLQDSISGYFRGPIATLPAGRVQFVAGAEYHHQALTTEYVQYFVSQANTSGTFERDTGALFAETRIPLIGSATNSGNILEATIAGRYDHYNDFGSQSTFQLSADFRPTPSLAFEASYATAFKAPSLSALNAPILLTPANFVIDPISGSVVLVEALTGGNPDLQALSGESHTFGINYAPSFAPGLRFEVTHWGVTETDPIQFVSLQTIVNNEAAFPGRVTRNSSGAITRVDARTVNYGSIDVAGLDYQLTYDWTSTFGDWAMMLNATQVYRYDAQLVPGSATIDGVSDAQDSGVWSPLWRGTAALTWSVADFTIRTAGRYVGSYGDYNGTREIGDLWVFDAIARLDLDSLVDGPASAFIEFGAVNIADEPAQYSNYVSNFVGYDPTQADVRGRYLYLQIGVRH